MSTQITLMTVCLMLSGCVGASELKHAPLNADSSANVLLFGGNICLLYTSPSPRDQRGSRMPSSA